MRKFLCYDTNDAASGKINVDSRGMLKPVDSELSDTSTNPVQNKAIKSALDAKLSAPVEGSAYKQIVTDGFGNTKWEDRLAYDDSRVVVDVADNFRLVRVSDEVPSFVSDGVSVNVWLSNGNHETVSVIWDTSGFNAEEYAYIFPSDNATVTILDEVVFPKKGVYFAYAPEQFYTSGIASANSDTPEITWDGNIEAIKKIDTKYIPSELNEIVLPSSTSGSSKKFKITVDDSGAISATEVTS